MPKPAEAPASGKADDKKADDKKADDKKADENKADEKKADDKKPDEKKPDEKKDSEKKGDGDDLNTILDSSQRAELTLLVANCTEAMRKLLLDNFSATAGLDQTLIQEGMTEDQKMMAADPNADMSKIDAEKKLKAENEKDLATLKMKNLKKNSLKTYDSWREQVLMRVGEVVNSQSTAKEQLKKEAGSNQAKPQAPNTAGKISDVPKKNVNMKFKDLFPPTKTPLTKLPMNKRTLVLHSILLLLISLEHYNAYSRILMLNICSSFKLPLKTFEQDEYTTAKGLLESARELTADEETKKKQEENKEQRTYRVRLAQAAGVAVLGIAGGMAAPLVAAGVGSVMGGLGLGATAAAGYLGSVAGSTVLVGGIFGAYGGRMTGQMMDKYAKEVEDFEFLPVHSRNKTSEDQTEGAKQASEHDHKLRVTICISGWLTEKDEVVKPWRVVGTGAEVFALKYELEALLNLGHAMDGMVTSAAWGYAQKELVGQTIFADLMSALWPMGLMKVARVLDNPFSVAKSRADKAGEVLADALINRAQGERPVTLIGYSLGARLIYTCLMSLAKRKAFGLVENAVMMGAPAPSDTSDWRVLRSVVSGRLVNVYSSNDYLLGFMYRTSSLQYGVAGLQPVRGLSSVENVDGSEDIDGHLRYRFLIGGILKKIGFEDVDMDAVEEERQTLEKMKEKEKKESLQAQRNRLMRRKSTQGKESEEQEAEHEASSMEKNVQQATEKSLTTRVIEYFYAPKAPNTQDAEKVAGHLQKAANNPADAQAALGDTVKDAQAATQSYSQYVMSKLPSMPGGSPASGAKPSINDPAGQATKATSDAAKAGQSYVQQASSYLPAVPSMTGGKSSTPNAKKAADDPSKATDDATKATGDATKDTEGYASKASSYLPSWGGKKEEKKPETAAEKATDNAKKAGEAGATGVKTAAGVTKDVVQPTVNNALNINDNPAVKAGKDTVKNTPMIQETAGKIPGANKGAEVASDTVGTTVQNTTGILSNTLNSTVEKGEAAGGKAGEAASGAAEKTGLKEPKKEEGYMSKAAGYVPSWGSGKKAEAKEEGKKEEKKDEGKEEEKKGGSYIPSMPSWGSGKKKPAKLERKESEQKTPSKEGKKEDSGAKDSEPKTEEKKSGGYLPSMPSWGSGKKKPAKLEKKPSEQQTPTKESVKSPERKDSEAGIKSPPKLGSRKGSEMKSPPPKLNRLPSGVKSPPANLERLPSGVKSPAAGAAKKLSEAPQQGMKAGTDAAKAGGDAAGKAARGGQDAVKNPTEAPGKAVKGGQDAIKAGGDAAGKVAKGGQDAAGKAAKAGADAPQQAMKAGGGVAKSGQDAAGKLAKGGQDMVKNPGQAPEKAVKGGQDAAGKVAKGGQDAVKAGGDGVGKAAATGQNAAGKVAKGGQDTVKAGGDAAGKAAKGGQDAAGKVAKGGQDAVKQGSGYLSSAGGAVTGSLPGWGSKK